MGRIFVPSIVCYSPHHIVIPYTSTSIKLRVSFDTSSKYDYGVSLNYILMVGPRIQNELYPIPLRFTTLPIIFLAEPMFKKCLRYLRILWENSRDPVECLSIVIYSMASAGFSLLELFTSLCLGWVNWFGTSPLFRWSLSI